MCRKFTKIFWPQSLSTSSWFLKHCIFLVINLYCFFLVRDLKARELWLISIWYQHPKYLTFNKAIIFRRPNKLFNLERTLETIRPKLVILQTEKWKQKVVNYLKSWNGKNGIKFNLMNPRPGYFPLHLRAQKKTHDMLNHMHSLHIYIQRNINIYCKIKFSCF